MVKRTTTIEQFGKTYSKKDMDSYVSLCYEIDKEKLLTTFKELEYGSSSEIILNFPFEQIHQGREFDVEAYNKIVRLIRSAYDKKYGIEAFKQKYGEYVQYKVYEEGEDVEDD